MKQLLTILFVAISMMSFADQLAYISKADADRAVAAMEKMKSIYLFCGCCSLEKPVKVNPTKVYAKFTGYEEYWEVYVEYVDENGVSKEVPLDLAYVWKKGILKYKTVGALLGLEHDTCTYIKDWKTSKEEE